MPAALKRILKNNTSNDLYQLAISKTQTTPTIFAASMFSFWRDLKYPYYQIYPKIFKAFQSLDISKVDFGAIKMPTIEVQTKTGSFIVGVLRGGSPVQIVTLSRNTIEGIQKSTDSVIHPYAKAYLGCCLVLQNEKNLDKLYTPIQKRGPGKPKGIAFGEQIEKSVEPHLRNPHLALFWCGPGRTQPVIKMRSGSLVNKVKVKKIPTGFRKTNETE